MASALGVPVGRLLRDDCVVTEVVISEQTISDVRSNGRRASLEAAERLARQLEPLIYQEATRPPVDISAGARPKPRRTRAQVLAGVRAAGEARVRADQRRAMSGGLVAIRAGGAGETD